MPPELILVQAGTLPAGFASRYGELVSRVLGLDVRLHPHVLDPEPAFVAQRAQYDTRRLLAMLESFVPDTRVMGLTSVDIFSSVFAFVFGEAHLGGRSAIVSSFRLNPHIYGLPEDPVRLERRLAIETLHEAGHLLGLVHCEEPQCAMYPSSDPTEVDLKPPDLCLACRTALLARR